MSLPGSTLFPIHPPRPWTLKISSHLMDVKQSPSLWNYGLGTGLANSPILGLPGFPSQGNWDLFVSKSHGFSLAKRAPSLSARGTRGSQRTSRGGRAIGRVVAQTSTCTFRHAWADCTHGKLCMLIPRPSNTCSWCSYSLDYHIRSTLIHKARIWHMHSTRR